MKYNIELSLMQRRRGTLTIEAFSRGEAQCVAQSLRPRDVAEWQVTDSELSVLAVMPAAEPRPCSCGTTHLIPGAVLESLRHVIDHFYDDAAEDYPTSEHRSGHIFEHLGTLDRWLGKPVDGHSVRDLSSVQASAGRQRGVRGGVTTSQTADFSTPIDGIQLRQSHPL